MAEQVRILMCLDCESLEEVPDYEGDPKYDTLLEYVIAPHAYADGTRHRGQLMKVDKRHWEDAAVRAEIVKRIRDKTGHTGLDPAFYDTKNTLVEDALKCFSQHHRNPKCGDYKTDSKRLTPGTAKERKAAGLPKYRSPNDKYLCDFCPVQMEVENHRYNKAHKK